MRGEEDEAGLRLQYGVWLVVTVDIVMITGGSLYHRGH